MKLPRDLSGRVLAQHLCKNQGYHLVHQTGSHLILQTEQPGHQRISIPNHPALRIGTLAGLLRTIAQHKAVDRSELLP
ncbi:MAG: addiction module toxin, HicA family [Verrucomicrobia bacterium]|nr:addiction module toxin, HicA family [Verrucomicrobiota bacterium]NBR63030.1 addiction module toxin, HicA family [Verrucomicrobiota bacterium]NBU68848.1 addiction module toxin, HicA family [Verrucomicrobiota bacterium]